MANNTQPANFIGTSKAANLFRGREAVGGRLHFDEKGMTFQSHKVNIQKGQSRIHYNEIKHIKAFRTLGIVPNGMAIVTKKGKEYRFVINNRKAIMAFLNGKVQD